MKYLIYTRETNNLIYDDTNKVIEWSDIKPNKDADRIVLQKILNDYINNNLEFSNDVHLSLISPIQNISVRDNMLNIDENFLGYISPEIKKIDIKNLEKNGGLMIISNKHKEIVRLIPNYNNSLRKDTKKETNLLNNFRDDSSNDYIETIIKIPKKIVETNDSEMIKRIFDSNIQIYRQVSNLSNHIEKINYELNFLKQNEERNYYYKHKIENLMSEIEILRKERSYLAKEISQAEHTSLNKLKTDLKQSQIAIERHIDLDNFPNVKSKLINLMTDLLKGNYPEEEIEKLFSNEDKLQELEDFSDNIDAKIQSLKEIKKDFISHKIIKTIGGEM
ncbi:hypothetical protein ACTFRD_27680 [Bacillus cereus group sp. MYBK249-1]|uniref:hypothetical protein n=1 Tax=Bacillus cereus group TaxID=86661 RepID=UPI001145D08A|nr:hypothetical protein [Bacillus cereus]MDA2072851.1 hypothetical protein [Bacillus cereus]HDR6217361.1 hypothetical protein [Bacillus cereus]